MGKALKTGIVVYQFIGSEFIACDCTDNTTLIASDEKEIVELFNWVKTVSRM